MPSFVSLRYLWRVAQIRRAVCSEYYCALSKHAQVGAVNFDSESVVGGDVDGTHGSEVARVLVCELNFAGSAPGIFCG
jgi:hypothetical protein